MGTVKACGWQADFIQLSLTFFFSLFYTTSVKVIFQLFILFKTSNDNRIQNKQYQALSPALQLSLYKQISVDDPSISVLFRPEVVTTLSTFPRSTSASINIDRQHLLYWSRVQQGGASQEIQCKVFSVALSNVHCVSNHFLSRWDCSERAKPIIRLTQMPGLLCLNAAVLNAA